MNWTEKQPAIAEKLKIAETGLPISSDSIESLFGAAKTCLACGVKDAYRIGIRLPAMCGQITPEDARSVFDVTVNQQKQFMSEIPSLIGQRRKVLPNPGSLEMPALDNATQRLELIPRSKNRSKNIEKSIISMVFMKDNGAQIRDKSIIIFQPNSRSSNLADAA